MQVNAKRDAPKRQPNTTKAGPGRRHVSGHKKASPVPSKGAPQGFVQHTNPRKNAVRAAKAASSPRQYRMARKAARRIAASGEAA
jgi:hypothetical protein